MTSRNFFSCLLATLVLFQGACASTTSRKGLQPPPTAAQVDLQRYLGTWYEIASFNEHYERDCYASSATYSLRPDGEISVLNSCHKGSLHGPEDHVQGRARVVDRQSYAKLEVSFFAPFWADYWVMEVAADYTYAAVGHPSRDHLWILNRTPRMDPSVYSGLVQRMHQLGYDTERLKVTPQPES